MSHVDFDALVDVYDDVDVHVGFDVEVNVERLMLVDVEIDVYVLVDVRSLVKSMFWFCLMFELMCKCF